MEQKICVQAGLLHRANGIVLEADFFYFFGIASFPLCTDKFLRSKVQNRFTDMLFTQS